MGGLMAGTQEKGMRAEQVADPESGGRPIPINAKFDNDFVTQLVLVLDTDTVEEAARKVAHHVVGRRIRPRDAGLVLRVDGKPVPSGLTVAKAGIGPLDSVFVGWAE